MNDMQHKELLKAIEFFGSQLSFARALTVAMKRTEDNPIRQSHIWTWLWRSKKGIPPEFCPVIEKMTGERVKKERLRPDVFMTRR